jgi:hypothetical protein
MAQIEVQDDEDVILVEFAPTAGVRSVSLSPADIAEKSKEAVDHALKTMRTMAKKSVKAIREIPEHHLDCIWLETERRGWRGGGKGRCGSGDQRHHDMATHHRHSDCQT